MLKTAGKSYRDLLIKYSRGEISQRELRERDPHAKSTQQAANQIALSKGYRPAKVK